MAVNINIPSQVRTFANLAAFPASGAVKTIYIAEDTNKTYRWTGSVYVEISGADFSGFVPTSRTLTINGVTQDLSADRTFTIATGLTVGTTPIASGTVGRVLFEGTGNVLQQSSSLFWDGTNNRLGIGTSTPTEDFEIAKNSATPLVLRTKNANNISENRVSLANDLDEVANFSIFGSLNGNTALRSKVFLTSTAANGFGFSLFSNSATANFSVLTTTSLTERFRIVGSTGNVLINTTTDAGFRLDVNGTARINTLTVGLGGGQQSTNTAVGVTALNANTTGVSNTAIGFEALLLNSTASGNTALGRRALRATTGASNIAIGNSAMENNTSGVANIGIGEGAGNVNTTGGSNIFIGNWSSGVVNNGANRTWIGNSSTTSTYLAGNVLINTTTDAGFRLDVNGTARVQGALSLTAGNVFNIGNVQVLAPNTGNDIMVGFNNSLLTFYTSNNIVGRFFSTGNFAIGTTTDVASSLLTLQSTTKGFLPPRMTTTQKNAIASPAAGLMVYDTTLNVISYYNGTSWI
jgi:hypothetical protein